MRPFSSKFLQIALWIIVIAALFFGSFYYIQYKSAQKEIQTIKTNSNTIQKTAAAQTQELIDKVGKLMELPKETPTIAVIVDASKLKNQPFFANGKNGDKILIYTAAGKAILYRESLNKIVDIAPVSIGTSSASASQSASPKSKN
jgi:hypothetical protein